MQGTKRALYTFDDETSTGIFYVPENSLVLIESTNKLYMKKNNTNLIETSTILDAITPHVPTENINLIVPQNIWGINNDGDGTGNDSEKWMGHKLLNISTVEPQPTDGVDGDIWFQREV